MTASPAQPLAVFDLDGTLTWHDTLLPFLAGYMARHPLKLLRIWRLPAALASYAFGAADRGILKSRVITMAMGGDERELIDGYADDFVAGMHRRRFFRPAALEALAAHRRRGDFLVLLSASPDLYVPRIGALLGFDLTVCTEVRWSADRLDGALVSLNRHGEEKRRVLDELRARHPGSTVAAYGNSAADLPHLGVVDRPLLVNGNRSARRAAAARGVPVDEWR
jgi:phosphatidylglycerophosphatase C